MAELFLSSKQDKISDGSCLIITKILGAIDGTTIHIFEDKLTGFFNKGIKNLILIFSDLRYINSTGMGLLAKYGYLFQEGGGNIKLVGLTDKVKELFDILGVSNLFKIYHTEEDAVNSFEGELLKSDISTPQNVSELLFQSKQDKISDGSCLIITKILGAIDGTTVRQFEDKLAEFFNQGAKNLILIFSDLRYINSTGMGLLVKHGDRFQEGGGNIKLVGLTDKVKESFDTLGLLNLFKIYHTEEDAVNSFEGELLKSDISTPQNVSNNHTEIASMTQEHQHGLTIKITTNLTTLKISGVLDRTTVCLFKDILSERLKKGVTTLILICSELKYIDSTNIVVLVGSKNRLEEKNGDIKLVGVTEKISTLFGTLGLLNFFKIYDTEEDAVESTIPQENMKAFSMEYYSFEKSLKDLQMEGDELRRLVSEGEILAFRDEDRMKFKKSDIDSLKKGRMIETRFVLTSDVDTKQNISSNLTESQVMAQEHQQLANLFNDCNQNSKPVLLGDYKIIKALGEGSMGTVYLAENVFQGKHVAIKVMKMSGDYSDNMIRKKNRFTQEIQVHSKLIHPNIVQVLTSGEHNDTMYFVMEYVEGKTLQNVIANTDKLAVEFCLQTTISIANAIEYAYLQENIIHRDIKPTNILISKNNQVKLADFGLGKILDNKKSLQESQTVTGEILGTPHYMSLEQLLDTSSVGHQSDIYSIGAVLYTMLAKVPPYAHCESIYELIADKKNGDCIRLKSLVSDVPNKILEVIDRATATHKQDRYQNILDLIFDLKLLLEKNINLNEVTTALITACWWGNLEAIKSLLDKGADPNIKDNQGKTALITACWWGNLEAIKLLLDKGADPNIKDNQGNTAYVSAFTFGYMEVVKLLLEKNIDINAANHEGKTALIVASEKACVEIVKLLLDKGADPNIKNNQGNTALSSTSNLGVVKLLLDKGADPNIKDNQGNTAYVTAFTFGNMEVVKLLLEKDIDINAANHEGKTALIVASEKACVEIVKLLLDKGADPNIKNNQGNTALSSTSNLGIVKLLLDKGADPNIKNNQGNTALSSTSNLGIVKLLLDKGADPNIKDNQGNTALTINSMLGSIELIELLLDNRADPNIKDNQGNTAYVTAFTFGNMEVVKLLLEKDVDINAANHEGKTALTVASEEACVEIVKLLLDNGADPNIKDNQGKTALTINSMLGSIELIKLLLDKGADPNMELSDE
jgi:anti-anti-sigma factor